MEHNIQSHNLEMNPFTLAFKSPVVEGEFLGEVANRRWPVLIFIFCFDVFCFLFRFVAKLTTSNTEECTGSGRPVEVVQEMGHQLANMAMLYVLIGLLNKRARTAGNNAARQEEVLLSICMGLAICNLLASLRADNAQDYVYMGYFLICTSTFLKIRWWVGTGLLATPTVAVRLWYSSPAPSALLPPDAVVHIVVAWAVGGLMAYLSDWYRRQMYANARLACAAHEKEMMEATARIQAQRELAAAQAQAAQRALTVAREKAAHEAKNEFMSLMCHEVRTPLNGCLASAEMLLETPLKEEQRELANTIRLSGSILLSTVSNFLDFFKLEAGKRLDIVRSEVSLAHLVGDVHCIIEAMIGRAGAVTLKQPQLLGVPELVFCDPDRLRGILLNLYTNAAKFTKAGHIVLRVRHVAREYTPPAPAGYSAIMLQPSYHPSSSSHRSMDMSSCIVMAPAAGSAPEVIACSKGQQQQQQEQQQPEQADEAADSSQQQQQGSPGQQARHDADSKPEQKQQPEHQPFWQQASHWARNLLPAGHVDVTGITVAGTDSPVTSASNSSSSLPSLWGKAAQHAEAGHAATAAAAAAVDAVYKDTKPDGPGSSKYDVHAMSSSTGSSRNRRNSTERAGATAGATAAAASSPSTSAAAAAANSGGSGHGSGGSVRSHTGRRNSMSSSDEACWLLFEVEDTGVGITRDGLATLFREYVQGTEDEMCKPRTRGGTGLGLSICSKQVGVLGGIIGAHSCRGHGSNFWFKIPTYVRRPKPHKQQQQQQQQMAANQQQQQQQQVAGSSSQWSAVTDGLQNQQRQSLEQQQRQQRQQQRRSLEQHQQSPAAAACSNSSSSNTGTYNVIHSGLYQSSSSGNSSSAKQQWWDSPQPGPGCSSGGSSAPGSSASHGLPPTPASKAGASTQAGATAAACQQAEVHQAAAVGGAPFINNSSQLAAVTSSSPAGQAHQQLQGPAAAAAAAAAAGTAPPVVSAGASGGVAAAGQQTAAAAAAASEAASALARAPSAAAAAAPTTATSSSTATAGASSSSSSEQLAVLQHTRPSLSLDGRAPAGPALDTAALIGRRVLLAEDNLINQTVARKMLSSLGMQVEVAANGLEALNAVKKAGAAAAAAAAAGGGGSAQQFSIVLMDMAMPVMGGVESTRKIRQEGFTLPIVAMTANASDRDRDECAAAGMNGFLSKPVLRDQLARAMLAAVEEYEGQQLCGDVGGGTAAAAAAGGSSNSS